MVFLAMFLFVVSGGGNVRARPPHCLEQFAFEKIKKTALDCCKRNSLRRSELVTLLF
jgi:hypothetical protein